MKQRITPFWNDPELTELSRRQREMFRRIEKPNARQPHLRGAHAGVRPRRHRTRQSRQPAWPRRCVVVQRRHQRSARRAQPLIDRGAETHIVLVLENADGARSRTAANQPLPAIVNDDHVKVPPRLRFQRPQTLLQHGVRRQRRNHNGDLRS